MGDVGDDGEGGDARIMEGINYIWWDGVCLNGMRHTVTHTHTHTSISSALHKVVIDYFRYWGPRWVVV